MDEEVAVKKYKWKGASHHRRDSASTTSSIIHSSKSIPKKQTKIILSIKGNYINYKAKTIRSQKQLNRY